jgi:hypothetical protein
MSLDKKEEYWKKVWGMGDAEENEQVRKRWEKQDINRNKIIDMMKKYGIGFNDTQKIHDHKDLYRNICMWLVDGITAFSGGPPPYVIGIPGRTEKIATDASNFVGNTSLILDDGKIIGDYEKGKSAVLIENVLTTGQHSQKTVGELDKLGIKVCITLCIISNHDHYDDDIHDELWWNEGMRQVLQIKRYYQGGYAGGNTVRYLIHNDNL